MVINAKAGVTFDGSERRLQTCGGLTAQLFDSTSPASFTCVSFFLLLSRVVVVSLCVVLVLAAFLLFVFDPSFVSLLSACFFCIFFFFHFF